MKIRLLVLSILAALLLGLGGAWVRLPGAFELHVLDIGQGDALLLRTPDGVNILVDGGPGQAVLEELGAVLSPFDKRLNLVVLTHPHEDHVAGLVPVLERFEVDRVLLSAPEYNNEAYRALMAFIAEEKIEYSFARADEDFEFGELNLDVLYPFEPSTGEEMANVNNASPVIKVTWRDTKILLMGDAEMEVEEELLEAGVDLRADILKAGHHGSRNSSTLEFLEVVEAELMLISCGLGNDYGHPHAESLQKAEDLEMEVLRTDLDGRISLEFGGNYSWLRVIFAPRLRSFSSSRS
ncbi:MAG: ComEC/Rec2 family competence protein [Candidatus Gracilibacteria bacterium]|jgi:competence protein ComEC